MKHYDRSLRSEYCANVTLPPAKPAPNYSGNRPATPILKPSIISKIANSFR